MNEDDAQELEFFDDFEAIAAEHNAAVGARLEDDDEDGMVEMMMVWANFSPRDEGAELLIIQNLSGSQEMRLILHKGTLQRLVNGEHGREDVYID